MRPPVFISNFAPCIEKYITFRCSIGYSESSYQRRMRQFDHFCAERFPDAHAISEEIAMEWACLQNGESENNQGQRISALKGLLDYLNASGIKSFTIPGGWIHRQKPFMPYLYSDSELICFFRGADSIPKCPLSGPREMIAPVVFRMHFCCGLRPQETIALHRNDVNLNDGILYIADSKGYKDRLVPMSGDLHRLCQKYDRLVSYIFPGREYFFQRSPGNIPITAEWQGDLFRACARNTGMNFDKYRCPRVYDFRHNFATHVIRKWMMEGKNISAMLPYLSAYMGHSSLSATAYYVHLVPEHFTETGFAAWGCMPAGNAVHQL